MSDASIYQDARTNDPDRTLTTLFMPKGCRASAIALLNFNAELTRIPAIVNDPTAALFRFQYWRDVIMGQSKHNAAWVEVLHQAISKDQLQTASLAKLIDARASLLDGFDQDGLKGIEVFVERTAGYLQEMIARLAGADDQLAALACHAGTGYGLVGLWPAIASQMNNGRPQLPDDLLKQARWRQGMAASLEIEQRLAQTLEPLLDRAAFHIQSAQKPAPKRFFGALSIARIAANQLAQLEDHRGSLQHALNLQTPPWMAPALACRWLVNKP